MKCDNIDCKNLQQVNSGEPSQLQTETLKEGSEEGVDVFTEFNSITLLPRPSPEPVNDTTNSKNALYHGLWVAQVAFAHPTGKMTQAFMGNQSKLTKLNNIKVAVTFH